MRDFFPKKAEKGLPPFSKQKSEVGSPGFLGFCTLLAHRLSLVQDGQNKQRKY